MRWMKVVSKNRGQRRYGGELRSYYNYGINGSGAVETYALRPGWHAGSLPTMRQIGKGPNKNLRDNRFVWVEGEVAADVDYQGEADANPDKDIPDRIPEDGYYLKATNADKAKSQADRVGWFVSGAFKANRIISDAEARCVIDQWNAEHPDQKVEYDYERESGVEFSEEDAARVNGGGEKATTIERSGAVSGNSSDGGLLEESSARQSHSPLTSPEDAAKVRRKTEITLSSAKKIQNEGGLKAQIDTPAQAIRAIGNGLHLDRSKSSQSYYGDVYEGDIMVDGRLLHLRVSDHEANGARMGNADADHKVEYDYERESGVEFSEADAARVNGGEKATAENGSDAALLQDGLGGEDRQGNRLNSDGTLYVEEVSSIDEITDTDFDEPSRSISLLNIPSNVRIAIGAADKPVIIKKNIFERNSISHSDLTPAQSREILQSALYNPDIYGQNQKTTKPHNWVVINTKDKAGKNRLVLLEVNQNKDNVEIVHWHYIRDNALETLKRQAEREGGRILILPSDNSEEGGDLSARTHGLPSGNKDSDNITPDQTNVAKTTESGGVSFRVRHAPNGEESRLDERQYDEVRTGNFKKWFGDWENDPENASKIVDANGEPLVVWHGTDNDFFTFDRGRLGENTDFNADEIVGQTAHIGFWFNRGGEEMLDRTYSKRIPVYLDIKEPVEFTSLRALSDEIAMRGGAERFVDDMRDAGHDGVVVKDEEFGGTSYVAFDPTQIKSATENNGDFSRESGDIRFRFVGERGAGRQDMADGGERMRNKEIAEAMERGGKDARSIKLATGWERGKDGKWRHEEGDGQLRVGVSDLLNGGVRRLDQVWDDPELFEAYPELREARVLVHDIGDAIASWSNSNRTLSLSNEQLRHMNEAMLRETIAHEMQHAIQSIESFAQGGSPDMMRQELLTSEQHELIEEERERLIERKSQLEREYIPIY